MRRLGGRALLGGEFGFELFADPVGAGDGEERLGVGLAGDGGVGGELLDALLGRVEPPTCVSGLFGDCLLYTSPSPRD